MFNEDLINCVNCNDYLSPHLVNYKQGSMYCPQCGEYIHGDGISRIAAINKMRRMVEDRYRQAA